MAMKIFTNGNVLSDADINEYLVNTKFAVKASDLVRSNTTTATNDPDLTMQVDANKIYYVVLQAQFHGNSVSNFKMSFTTPSGSTMSGGLVAWFVVSGQYGTQPYGGSGTAFGPGQSASLAGQDPFDSIAQWTGILDTAGTAGTFALRWAQDTSGGFATALRAGSSLTVFRVA